MKSSKFKINYLGKILSVIEFQKRRELFYSVNMHGKLIEIHPSNKLPGAWAEVIAGETERASQLGNLIESFQE